MSTVFYDAHELGNLARVVADNPRRQPRLCMETLQEACETLACYSIVNADAYNERYPHHAKAVPETTEDIMKAAKRDTAGTAVVAALRVYQLLVYNTDGLMPDEIAARLQRLGSTLAGRVADALELR